MLLRCLLLFIYLFSLLPPSPFSYWLLLPQNLPSYSVKRSITSFLSVTTLLLSSLALLLSLLPPPLPLSFPTPLIFTIFSYIKRIFLSLWSYSISLSLNLPFLFFFFINTFSLYFLFLFGHTLTTSITSTLSIFFFSTLPPLSVLPLYLPLPPLSHFFYFNPSSIQTPLPSLPPDLPPRPLADHLEVL